MFQNFEIKIKYKLDIPEFVLMFQQYHEAYQHLMTADPF